MLWIRIGFMVSWFHGFNVDPDQAFNLNVDPDTERDQGSQTNADPGGSGSG